MKALAFCLNFAMEISEVWGTHLCAIVDQIAPGDPRTRGLKRRAFREIADVTGLNEEYIYQVYTGRKKAGQDLASALDKAYGDGRPTGWINSPLIPEQSIPRENALSTAQQLIPSRFRMPQRPVFWWRLKMDEVTEEFEATLGDDAMAPEFPAGMVVRFKKATRAAFGNRVILLDKRGVLHFREYTQSFDGDIWIGRATGRGYEAIRPSRDGAKVVAIKTAHVVDGP